MLTPGLRVADHYTLERSLGEGAMGEVWAARHVQLDHRVAIKFATDTPSDEDARETFLREARLAAAVRHRHVVRVIDVGTDSEVPYLVMEFLEGDTLADRMDFGALPPRLAAQIAIQILGALEACHREGVIHRDLKPENVFLSPEDSFVTLVDFGIAKAAASSGRQSAVPTREGAVFGTPEYMAPEQARGDDLDHRADVFAAGVLFYEMLAGRRPFEGNTSFQVLLGVLQGEFTPLETLRPDLPELAAVIHKAMAPDPASRFGSAAEMRDAIRTVVRESSAPPPPPAPVTRPRSWMAATFVGAMLIFGAVAMGAKAGGVERATDGSPVPERVEADFLVL
ncbi:MAG: serine/threonine-protein kinase, partial [Myxococcota bacterium]